ncbi:unnamed protein product [Miscanthus lutarioriparius]|uniref:Uncharacterized protein n=1 Tax=Miscanthus lutarioriparius TaxID=422564 RepID=A0A811SC53_9POAL|nr:unnamed protein product [Miscanthus lutarioriparius]
MVEMLPPTPTAAAEALSILHGADAARLLPASGIAPTPELLQHLRPALPTLPDSAIPALARWAGAATAVSLLASRRLFAAAWRFLLLPPAASSPPPPLAAFAPLLRRYARLGRTNSAARAFRFLQRHLTATPSKATTARRLPRRRYPR